MIRELGVQTGRAARRAAGRHAAHPADCRSAAASYDLASAERWGLEHSRYEGPTGIVGVLQDACVRAGIPAISFWAHVPHYVSQPPCPKATLALLHRVEEVLDVAGAAGRPARGGRRVGEARRRDGRTRTTRSPSTCARSRSATARARCRRPAATRSPRSSSATCAGGSRRGPAAPAAEPVGPSPRDRSRSPGAAPLLAGATHRGVLRSARRAGRVRRRGTMSLHRLRGRDVLAAGAHPADGGHRGVSGVAAGWAAGT